MKKKIIGLITVTILVILDLIAKSYFATTIALNQRQEVIANFFWFTNVRNTGAAWSLFESHTWMLALISGVASLVIMMVYLKKKLTPVLNIAGILILAGTLGNFVDRLLLGYVRDFLSFNLFGYMFPVFNLADSFLTIGVAILILDTLLTKDETHE